MLLDDVAARNVGLQIARALVDVDRIMALEQIRELDADDHGFRAAADRALEAVLRCCVDFAACADVDMRRLGILRRIDELEENGDAALGLGEGGGAVFAAAIERVHANRDALGRWRGRSSGDAAKREQGDEDGEATLHGGSSTPSIVAWGYA